jgi:hypothetical protein
MKIIISIILWIIVARIFLYIGKKYLWPEDNDDFDNLGY